MVIEGILTTENLDGSMHVAPIGPHVNAELTTWTLKPFQSSSTFQNLHRSNRAIFHVVDDPLLMASAVLGLCNRPVQGEELAAAHFVSEVGWILEATCRWFALSVHSWDVTAPRAIAECNMTSCAEIRSFWGWNRARHSILELAIIASRMHMMERNDVDRELAKHKIIIEKTAGDREMAAWELLREHLSP